jgi:hypothetical protein
MPTDEARQHRVELFATVLLAVAALATAWSTYQSTQWRGQQAIDAARATKNRIQSSESATRAGQLTQIDIATYVQWVNADVAGDQKLARFYRKRFRPEFKPAFAAWLATDPRTNPKAPLTPFAMPQYRVDAQDESKRLNAAAGVYSGKVETDNKRADNYVLAVVLFAAALFFAGISTKIRPLRQREMLLGLGWLIFLGVLAWVVLSPIRLSV